MADRGNVIYSIERCICHVPDACRDCGYDNEPCPKCFEHLLRDAHDLLKAQEPRVMTLEEVEDALDTVVWLDMPGAENLADGFSLIMAYSRKNGWVWFDSPFGDNPSQDRFEYEDYNKTWRCWTSRPSDSERRNTSWEN
jgi:hypothetical protein